MEGISLSKKNAEAKIMRICCASEKSVIALQLTIRPTSENSCLIGKKLIEFNTFPYPLQFILMYSIPASSSSVLS